MMCLLAKLYPLSSEVPPPSCYAVQACWWGYVCLAQGVHVTEAGQLLLRRYGTKILTPHEGGVFVESFYFPHVMRLLPIFRTLSPGLWGQNASSWNPPIPVLPL